METVRAAAAPMSLLMIPSTSGTLEARYHSAPPQHFRGKVLLIPPHPQHDGDMENSVVYTLYRCFAAHGFSVLRFNFPGCGKSRGKFPDDNDVLAAASSCFDWMSLQAPATSSYWVAGFSFGAWVAMQLLMRRPECNNFIVASPPIDTCDFSFLMPCPTSGLVIYGEHDPMITRDSVMRFTMSLSTHRQKNEISQVCLPGSDRAFTHSILAFEEICSSHIAQTIARADAARAELEEVS